MYVVALSGCSVDDGLACKLRRSEKSLEGHCVGRRTASNSDQIHSVSVGGVRRMLVLKDAAMTGILGSKEFRAEFREDVNFLVGRNGAGKTTVINLLQLAISGDIERLQKASFSTIKLGFLDENGRTAELAIRRAEQSNPEKLSITFHQQGQEPLTGETVGAAAGLLGPFQFASRSVRGPIRTMLSKLRSTWVSVNRYEATSNPFSSVANPKSAIDSRLDDIRQRLRDHIWQLWSSEFRLNQEFMRDTITSLLDPVTSEPRGIRDTAEFERRMVSLLEEFGRPEDAKEKIQSHVATLLVASASTDESAILVRASHQRLLDMLERYDSLEESRNRVRRGFERFKAIVNETFWLKSIDFDDNKTAQFHSPTVLESSVIELESLSSGEKQFFVFLAETLLQNGERCIFMADEPEISLHVQWQSELVKHVRDLNPKAQIIFATHSPEILSSYGDAAIDLAQ